MKTFFYFLLFCLGFIHNTASAQLAAGDIAIVGVNTDGAGSTDEITILTLKAIPSGTTIYFSDYYWDNTNSRWGNDGLNGTTINNSEGIAKWTTTTAIAATTVFKISLTNVGSSGSPSISGLPGTTSIVVGWALASNPVGPFGSGNDNFFIYQSNNNGITPSNWIFGWTNGLNANVTCNNCWQANSTNSSTFAVCSMLPTGLTNGTSAVSFAQIGTNPDSNPSFDNNVYNAGSFRVGSKAAILAAICTPANWIGNESTAYDISPTSTYFTGANTFALPVRLMFFSANHTESGNLLTWKTATETNNEGFDIETSKDGVNFQSLEFVKGRGTTSETQNYTFTHRLSKNESGILYYRLKQMDFDGQFEYSKIIVVRSEGKQNSVAVYPNPSNGLYTISLDEKAEIEQISLMTITGQSIDVNMTNNQLDLSNEAAGVYFLQVNGQNIRLVKK